MIQIISTFRGVAFVVGAFTLLSACSAVGPNYVRPAATQVMPASYKESNGWKQAEPQDSAIKGKWWEIYSDPQLNALEEQVEVTNQNVLAAEAQFRQARALIQAARAGFYPTISVGGSVTNSRQSATMGGSGSRGDATTYALPVDVSWEVDIWGRIRRSVEANRAGAQASAADLAAVRL